jgi:hypothetical protein
MFNDQVKLVHDFAPISIYLSMLFK